MRYIVGIIFAIISLNVYASELLADIKNIFTPNYNEEKINDAPFPLTRPALQRNVFIFDPAHLSWAVYNKEGQRVGMGRASGGADYCADIHEPCHTVEGTFTVFRKENADCTSKTFPIDEGGGAPMPHCMFFHKGYAIHGSNNIPNENRSHGCIRVTKKAAEWMNTNYIHQGSVVIVSPYPHKVT